MTLIFWILVAIASLSGVAATLLTENGGFIFFAGYFIGMAGSAVVAKYKEDYKK